MDSKIVLPLTLPGMGATLAFVFTAAWSELLFALMLINSEDQKEAIAAFLEKRPPRYSGR